ncbi:MAG TPA: uroporphyrinogen decarboxylase family protein [bacterium]|nr:uroporphyrinogen decarboxylase family protein [bacterium]
MDIWKDQSEQAKKERWKALWAGEELPRPLWFIPASPVLALAMDWLGKGRSVTGLFMDRDVQFHESMKFNKFFTRAQKWWSKDDFVLHLQPQMGVGAFASAFGCRTRFPWDQMPWSYPLLKEGDAPERVYEIKPPDVRDGLLGDILDFAEYFDQKAEHKYPIAMTDLQGPMDTAYLVWDSCDFMVAMYEHPKEVHHLMRLVTDLIIRFVKEMRSKVREFVPAHFPPVYLPDGMGLAVSEDALAVLSKNTYAEFSLPYINELSEEFGGIVIHSCGNIAHQLDNLKQVRGLRGINFGVSETKFEAVWEALSERCAIIPHCSTEMVVRSFRNAADWVEDVLKRKTHNRGLALMVPPAVGDIHKIAVNSALGKKRKADRWALLKFGRDIRRLVERYA